MNTQAQPISRTRQFMNDLAKSKHLALKVLDPARKHHKFAMAAALSLPMLAMLADATMAQPTPTEITQQTYHIEINGQQVETPFGGVPTFKQANDMNSVLRDPHYKHMLECVQDAVNQAQIRNDLNDNELGPIEKAFAAGQMMLYTYRSLEKMNLQDDNPLGQDKTADMKLKVAAFCANPFDWQAEITHWKEKARNSAAFGTGERLARQADQAIADYAVYQATAYHTMQYAAQQYRANGFDRSLVHKTSNDWVGAAFSIAGGLADAFGSRDARQDVNRGRNKARRAQSVGRRVENLNRRQGAAKWNEIGRIIGDSGRVMDLGEAISRSRPRVR